MHQVQRPEFPPAGQLVMCIVHRPHFVRTGRKREWHPRFGSKSLAPPTLHRQPFLPVQPIHPLVVHPPPKRSVPPLLPPQPHLHPPLPQSRPPSRHLPHPPPRRRGSSRALRTPLLSTPRRSALH